MTSVPDADKARILNILCAAFDANKSVAALAGTGNGRRRRIRALMDYSLEVCRRSGAIYLAEDRMACALVIYPERKRLTPASLWLDLKLICKCIGLVRLPYVLRREARINRAHPQGPFAYLWFVGVDAAAQGQGHGTRLLTNVLADSARLERPVYLETSTEANLPWYRRAGFRIYLEADFGYPLYFLHSAAAPDLRPRIA
jgi:ribosomal protein S18 acetylase RimI-like enzyme